MPDESRVNALWVTTQARLPAGWSIDGLRCASTGLTVAERSDDWVAVAVGPGSEVWSARARTPEEALVALVAGFQSEAPVTSR